MGIDFERVEAIDVLRRKIETIRDELSNRSVYDSYVEAIARVYMQSLEDGDWQAVGLLKTTWPTLTASALDRLRRFPTP